MSMINEFEYPVGSGRYYRNVPARFALAAFAILVWCLIGPLVFVDSVRKMLGGFTRAELTLEESQFSEARGDESRLRGYLSTCKACERRDEANSLVGKFVSEREVRLKLDRDKKQGRDDEQKQYSAARGDFGMLSAYVSFCKICEHKAPASQEMAALKQRESERYASARGNAELLKGYVRDCRACEFGGAANTEVARLEAPRPNMTWKVSKNFDGPVALTFYSAARRFAWSAGSEPYLLSGQTPLQYTFNCNVGESVCYGAWSADEPTRFYWGKGPGAAFSCPDCCRICNGREYNVVLDIQARQSPPNNEIGRDDRSRRYR